MMNRRVTLSEIAREAGTSVMAASVVLNGARSNTRVSPEACQRLKECAARLGYQPNTLARSLRRRKTDLIGFYGGYGYQDIKMPFVAELLSGMQRACEACQKDIVLYGSFRKHDTEALFGQLVGGTIDALVLLAPEDDPLATRLRTSNLPVIAVGDPLAGLPLLGVDDAEGGRLAARHLAERGCQRLAFRCRQQPRQSQLRRETAFLAEARLLGLPVVTLREARESALLDDASQEIFDRFAPDGVFCATDPIALRQLADARKRGLPCPELFRIVGFDGIKSYYSPHEHPTTICAPWADVAERAVHALIHGELPAETLLPVRLEPGETT
jgi:DNA-binding LacI/PurR family transcriptional regulator